MGEYLAARGRTVLGIRLAGHATQPQDMLRCTWRDWLAAVEDGVNLLRSAGKQVFVMGLSMGGALTLMAAARYPIRGAVAMSTPFALREDWRLPYLRTLSRLQPSMGKGQPDWHNPAAAQDHVDYPTYPTRAIAELNDLLAAMRSDLPAVRVPVLLVQSHKDQTVPFQQAEQIRAQLGSTAKDILWLQESGHVVTREPEREQVFAAADDFIRRVMETE